MGMLSYRALKWMSTVGVAPKWADALLLLLVGAMLFVGMFAPILFFMNGSQHYLLLLLAVAAWGATYGIWYWSNHFRHRVPVSVQDSLPTPPEPPALPDEVTNETPVQRASRLAMLPPLPPSAGPQRVIPLATPVQVQEEPPGFT
jgi:hypothetical protein